MAASSGQTDAGTAVETFTRSTFTHAASGFRYEVWKDRRGLLRFSFTSVSGSLRGTKPLRYFVGSGATARSYLIADDGYLFEAPVAFYTAGRRWDLAPRYELYTYPYLTRPAMPGCLACHASFIAVAPDAQNRYAPQPFGEPGVACERCHGPGAEHAVGRGAIVNPSKLDPERRDGVCAQCHLSGEVRVWAPGAAWNTYQPGARLADSVKAFVRANGNAAMTVTGHVEKLARSACKLASGDRMWCGSCHDPHRRATSFRARCLGCHQAEDCREGAAARRSKRDDCAACHMPKTTVRDAQHVVYTDHSIPVRPRAMQAGGAAGELIAFGGVQATGRDLGLAYAIAGDRQRALPLLETVALGSAADAEPLVYLAEIYRNDGRADDAMLLYERALELAPAQVTASVGLGAIRMERGQYAQAIRLWEDALARNAGLVLVRTNLASAYLRLGDRQAAEKHLRRTLELSPAFEPAADLLRTLNQPR